MAITPRFSPSSLVCLFLLASAASAEELLLPFYYLPSDLAYQETGQTKMNQLRKDFAELKNDNDYAALRKRKLGKNTPDQHSLEWLMVNSYRWTAPDKLAAYVAAGQTITIKLMNLDHTQNPGFSISYPAALACHLVTVDGHSVGINYLEVIPKPV